MTTSQFKIVLTRYANGGREISDAEFVNAADFNAACATAAVMCRSAQQASGHEYAVLSVEATGYHGHRCRNAGGGIWQRADDPTSE